MYLTHASIHRDSSNSMVYMNKYDTIMQFVFDNFYIFCRHVHTIFRIYLYRIVWIPPFPQDPLCMEYSLLNVDVEFQLYML